MNCEVQNALNNFKEIVNSQQIKKGEFHILSSGTHRDGQPNKDKCKMHSVFLYHVKKYLKENYNGKYILRTSNSCESILITVRESLNDNGIIQSGWEFC